MSRSVLLGAMILLGLQVGATFAAEPKSSWAFLPVRAVSPPAVKDSGWPLSPVDRFVLGELEARGLAPAPAADKTTLIRRVTFDLIGLPPTPEQIDAFLTDQSADAVAKVVDRLLASPHYGERWARHWLDGARFCESQGFERDKIRDHAWPYRDYIIHSFNADKPYSQFVKEQIAGDVLDPVTPEGIAATGFLVAGPWDEVGATQQGELMRLRVREEELEDMIAAVGQTFLGLTVNCARCHSHKFDPIPQKDYYRLKAVFEGVRPADRRLPVPPKAKAPSAAMAYAAGVSQPGPTFVLSRGEVEKKKEQVSAGGLSAVKTPAPELGLSFDAPEGPRRLKFADWLVHPEHPLTARVLVNRVWHYHFGRGLVGTPNDFGVNGEPPSHPQLLDWLARQFVADGWSIKRLQRRLLLSRIYQQGSQFNEKAAALDGDNRLLWRFSPRRLEGEAVRDAMLASSGQLSRRLGGPSFRPFVVKVFNSHFYELTDPLGPEFNRRTVYRINVNSAKSPLLDALDCPDPSVKTPRRGVTTTPLQALGMMNNSFVLRQARFLADRVEKEAASNPQARIDRIYRLTVGRPPTVDEIKRAQALATDHGLESVGWVLFNSNEFLYVK